MTMKKRYGFILLLLLIFAGALIPETPQVPVHQASAKDWHKDSFWYYPWGTSGVHKGIDIFAARGTQVQAPTPMLRLYQGEWRLGGKVVLALGPGWKLHYFAHLDSWSRTVFIYLRAANWARSATRAMPKASRPICTTA